MSFGFGGQPDIFTNVCCRPPLASKRHSGPAGQQRKLARRDVGEGRRLHDHAPTSATLNQEKSNAPDGTAASSSKSSCNCASPAV